MPMDFDAIKFHTLYKIGMEIYHFEEFAKDLWQNSGEECPICLQVFGQKEVEKILKIHEIWPNSKPVIYC